MKRDENDARRPTPTAAKDHGSQGTPPAAKDHGHHDAAQSAPEHAVTRRSCAAITESPVERASLAAFTEARVALGRAGSSLPTGAHLRFVGDHARARDAVWSAVDFVALALGLEALGLSCCQLRSRAPDRAGYLRRPDLGGLLDAQSSERLSSLAIAKASRVALVVADGLSAEAVQRNALPLIAALLARLGEADRARLGEADRARLGEADRARLGEADRARPGEAGLAAPTTVLVEQGRVAIGDPVGLALGADVVVLLIGERPGLSAADSLGCYVTWRPRPGTPDSRRNCVSNIREGGLSADLAATKIAWLVTAALERGLTGVELKEDAALFLEGRR